MDKTMFDKVVELVPGQRATVLKNVSINEGFFEGHFPDHPVMPGALIVEAMSQASLMLLSQAEQGAAAVRCARYRLASVKAKFINPVLPGDQLRISAVLTGPAAAKTVSLSAEARVTGSLAAKADLVFDLKDE